MATWPSALEIGEGATPNELDIDKPITSSQAKRLRDRDARLNDALQDGVTAPFDLTPNNVTVAGVLTANNGIVFPELALIHAGL